MTKKQSDEPPTERQKQFARNLGVAWGPNTTGRHLGNLIKTALERHSRAVLRDYPDIRVGRLVTYKGVRYMIQEISENTWKARLTPCLPGKTAHVYLLTLVEPEDELWAC